MELKDILVVDSPAKFLVKADDFQLQLTDPESSDKSLFQSGC